MLTVLRRVLPALLLPVVLLSAAGAAQAQALEVVDAAGGDAAGAGGSVSYSVGQLVYLSATGAGGSLAEGIQFANIVVALPVELLDVQASCTNGTAVVAWRTASERGNRYFDVERSADAAHWQAVGRVAGAGSSMAENKYTFTDAGGDALPAGTRYYRLRQVDASGAERVSATARLEGCGSGGGPSLSVYPNPTTDGVFLSGIVVGQRYEVLAADGRVAAQGALAAGRSFVSLAQLSPSVYWLRVLDDGRQVSAFRLVKQ